MAGTADDLLTSIKLRSAEAANGAPLSDAELLSLADEEIRSRIAPLIMSRRENYYVSYVDHALQSGVSRYRIPHRAIGGKLTSLSTVAADGSETQLSQIDNDSIENGWRGFRVEGNHVIINSDTPGVSLRMRFVCRPNQLVVTTDASKVSRISSTSDLVVTTGSAITGDASGDFDIVKGTSGYELVTMDNAGTIAGTSVTLTDSFTGVEPGDYLCRAGYTPFPQIPLDLHPVLAQRVVVVAMNLLGYESEVERAMIELQKMEDAMFSIINPRVDAAPKKIRNNSLLGRL